MHANSYRKQIAIGKACWCCRDWQFEHNAPSIGTVMMLKCMQCMQANNLWRCRSNCNNAIKTRRLILGMYEFSLAHDMIARTTKEEVNRQHVSRILQIQVT